MAEQPQLPPQRPPNLLTMNPIEPHPFDNAFGLIRKMRAELAELKSAFAAEQQQRAQEVLALKSEVTMLRHELVKEKGERQSQCHKLATDFTQESSTRIKGLDEIKMQHRQHLGQLNSMLQDEIRDRKASEHIRDTREAALLQERESERSTFTKEVVAQKQVLMATKDEHATRLNSLGHDIEVVVHYLSKVSNAWEGLKVTKLLSSERLMNLTANADDSAEDMPQVQYR